MVCLGHGHESRSQGSCGRVWVLSMRMNRSSEGVTGWVPTACQSYKVRNSLYLIGTMDHCLPRGISLALGGRLLRFQYAPSFRKRSDAVTEAHPENQFVNTRTARVVFSLPLSISSKIDQLRLRSPIVCWHTLRFRRTAI